MQQHLASGTALTSRASWRSSLWRPVLSRPVLSRSVLSRSVLCLVLLTATPAAGLDLDKTISDAITARGKRDFQGAKKLLHSVLVEMPKHARALHELGVLHALFGELDKAADLFRDSLAADPSMTVTRRNLAEILRAAGRYGDALPHFKRLQTDAASRDIALRGLAICEEAQGHPEAAIAALDKLSKTHSDDDMAVWVRQQRALLAAGRDAAGISVGAAQAEAKAHFERGNIRHAAHWYELACRKGPSADRCYKYAVALLGVRDYLAAVGALAKTLRIDPQHMPALSAWPLAVRKLRSEGSGALQVDLPKEITAQPIQRAARALLNGDLLLARRGAKAAQKGPHGGVVLQLIEAEALLRDGYHRPADKILQALVRKAPGHHIASAMRAEVMFRDHHYSAARKLAGLPTPAAPPATASDEVRAAYGSPIRDLLAFVRWRRRAFDHHMRMLLDSGIKPPAPFSFADEIDPESVRATPAAQPGQAPRKRPKSRKRQRR